MRFETKFNTQLPLRRLLLLGSTVAMLLAAVAPSAAAGRMPLGVNGGVHPPQSDMSAMAAAGARWTRVAFRWSDVEKAKGVLDWTQLDADVRASAVAGIALHPVLTGSPDWAIDPSKRGAYDSFPKSSATYAAWVGAAARRYGPKGSFWTSNRSLRKVPITEWEIWNEPNLAAFFSGPQVSPLAYARLLQAASAAIKAVDRTSVIVAAGLANAQNADNVSAMTPENFWKATWKLLGTRKVRDYQWGVHIYSDTAPHAAAVVPYVRGFMESYGCKSCVMNIGEVGWTSGAIPVPAHGFSFVCAGSPDAQATIANDFLTRIAPNLLVALELFKSSPFPLLARSIIKCTT
jgi:hypothetical protein